jgi:hypothetical protein
MAGIAPDSCRLSHGVPVRAADVGFPLHRWHPQLARPPGSQPGRELPEDHCRPSAALATIQPAVTGAGRLALVGFLAGYRGLTREAWCHSPGNAWTPTRAWTGPGVRD